MNPKPPDEGRTRLARLIRRPLPLESETSWLLLLGILDLVLTVVLLQTGAVREANPVGRLCLKAGGLRGLVLLKCGLLLVIVLAVQGIALRRPRTARAVLWLGMAVQGLAASYGAWLLAGFLF
jgi:hypothetical protein